MAFKADIALQFVNRARERGRLGHAYLICGPKEADLPAFAVRMLNLVSGCAYKDLDTWEKHGICVVRPESKSRQIKVDAVREQVEPYLFVTSSGAEHRLVVIVDAERMNVQAQNAFLRTLEEPPPRTLFLLLSEQPQQFLETILSRVIRISLMPEENTRKLSESEVRLVDLLSDLANRKSDSLAGAMTCAGSLRRSWRTSTMLSPSSWRPSLRRRKSTTSRPLMWTTPGSSLARRRPRRRSSPAIVRSVMR